MEHLSIIAEQYGLKFEYEVSGETVVQLIISSTKNPDVNTAIDAMVVAIGMLAECCYESVALFNRDQPLITRHQQLHMLHQIIGEQAAKKMAAAVDRTKTEIEIVH
jgi:hypothetical protein